MAQIGTINHASQDWQPRRQFTPSPVQNYQVNPPYQTNFTPFAKNTPIPGATQVPPQFVPNSAQENSKALQNMAELDKLISDFQSTEESLPDPSPFSSRCFQFSSPFPPSRFDLYFQTNDTQISSKSMIRNGSRSPSPAQQAVFIPPVPSTPAQVNFVPNISTQGQRSPSPQMFHVPLMPQMQNGPTRVPPPQAITPPQNISATYSQFAPQYVPNSQFSRPQFSPQPVNVNNVPIQNHSPVSNFEIKAIPISQSTQIIQNQTTKTIPAPVFQPQQREYRNNNPNTNGNSINNIPNPNSFAINNNFNSQNNQNNFIQSDPSIYRGAPTRRGTPRRAKPQNESNKWFFAPNNGNN